MLSGAKHYSGHTMRDAAGTPVRTGLTTRDQGKPVTLVYRPAPYARGWSRRCFDFAVAVVVLLVTLPLLLVATIAIVVEDPGSPLFSQKRVGRFGKLFTIYKLRTMYLQKCGDAISPSGKGDSRITRVGAILRRTSIDELPQLWNVVRGEMALIGPRPEMPFVVQRYEPWQHLRHLVTPGLTGLWQTTCRSEIPLHRPEATLLDIEYIRSLSLGMDARIIANTVRTVLFAKGAY